MQVGIKEPVHLLLLTSLVVVDRESTAIAEGACRRAGRSRAHGIDHGEAQELIKDFEFEPQGRN